MKKQIIALFVFVGSLHQLCAQVEVEVGDRGEQENNNESFGTRLAPEQTRAQQIANSQKQQVLGSQVPFVQDAPGPVDDFTDTTGLGSEDSIVAIQRVVMPVDSIGKPTGIAAEPEATNVQAARALGSIVGNAVKDPKQALDAVRDAVGIKKFTVWKKILMWFSRLIRTFQGKYNVTLTPEQMDNFVESTITTIALQDGMVNPNGMANSTAIRTVKAVQDQLTDFQQKRLSQQSKAQAMRQQMLATRDTINQEIANAWGSNKRTAR